MTPGRYRTPVSLTIQCPMLSANASSPPYFYWSNALSYFVQCTHLSPEYARVDCIAHLKPSPSWQWRARSRGSSIFSVVGTHNVFISVLAALYRWRRTLGASCFRRNRGMLPLRDTACSHHAILFKARGQTMELSRIASHPTPTLSISWQRTVARPQ